MKKVTTKVVLLMLVLPLLLIFAINTTINVTTILTDIPVTSVSIEGDKIRYVNVLDANNTIKLNAIVYPNEATNKNVTYSLEDIANEKNALVELSQDGTVKPLSTGSVMVVATADGGRQDKVQINFYSEAISSVELINGSFSVDVGSSKKITIGSDYTIYPNSSSGSITYSSNNNKVSVDRYTGEFIGLFEGNSIITASIDGIKYNQNTGAFENYTYQLDFNISVSSNGNSQVLSFAGGSSSLETPYVKGEKTIPFNYFGYDSLGQLSYQINEEDSQYVESVVITYLEDNEGMVKVTLSDDAPKKMYSISLYANSFKVGEIQLEKKDPSISLSMTQTTFAISNANIKFGVVVEGIENYDVRYESTDSTVFYVNSNNNECVSKAKKEGSARIRAILYVNGEKIATSEYREITVVNPYVSLVIKENSKVYGLENRFVLGKYRYENTVKNDFYKLELSVLDAKGNSSDINMEKVIWKSSDETIARIDSEGKVTVLKTGIVTITVESAYNELLGTTVKNSFEIKCQEQGLNVYNYSDLMFANANGYETVLMNNILLADQINESNYRDYLTKVVTFEMDTTADKAYYEGNGKSSDAKIRYCVEFTSNVYGNGYSIDANNITRSVDKYNYSVFNGPLNFVAISYDNNSSVNAKIKAQDNIVFLVKKDNISINNVELKGCSDSSLIEGNKTNLGKLDNAGTVLEIVGNNTSLLYSRVNNGRTVVRIYGKAHESDSTKLQNNISDYKTVTTISNCIMSYAREFILKVGSNQILRNNSITGEELETPTQNSAKYDHAAPFFTKEDGTNYSLSEEKDEYFIENYLMNDVILKDSVFYGAGLFCIGMDTQFAGLVLHGYDYGSYKFSELGWKDVAGTSYPVRIKMQGDVRFYDWKVIDEIDSGTLVEGDKSLLNTIGLNLDVSKLLDRYNEENKGNNIVATYEGKDYVNAAIVFYGGGKNYSWIDTSEVNVSFNELDSFEVPVGYFSERPDLIYYSAGKENFRFMVYNNKSNLNYQKQQEELNDGTAYSWLIRSK